MTPVPVPAMLCDFVSPDANRMGRTLSSSTDSVDNFVDNRQANRWRLSIGALQIGLLNF